MHCILQHVAHESLRKLLSSRSLKACKLLLQLVLFHVGCACIPFCKLNNERDIPGPSFLLPCVIAIKYTFRNDNHISTMGGMDHIKVNGITFEQNTNKIH